MLSFLLEKFWDPGISGKGSPFPPSAEFLPVEIYFDYPENSLGCVGEVISGNPILKLICLDCSPMADGYWKQQEL